MNIGVEITGVEKLRSRINELASHRSLGKATRRGMREAMGLLAKAQKNMAPVRRPRLSMRTLDEEMKIRKRKRGGRTATYRRSLSKATAKASRVNRKWKSFKQKGLAPGQRFEIKPGLLKRSIHFRTKLSKWGWVGKAGMNVGLKKNDIRRAPHAAFVGLGTKQRRTKSGADRGQMPQNTFVRDASNMAAPKALRILESRVREDFERLVLEVASR